MADRSSCLTDLNFLTAHDSFIQEKFQALKAKSLGAKHLGKCHFLTIAITSPHQVFAHALPHQLSKSLTSSGEPCLYCSGGHSE